MFGIPIGGYKSCLSFLSSALSETEEGKCCNLLLTKGNEDTTSMSYNYKKGMFGYPCLPVKAGLFRVKDGEVWHKSVILYRPVGIRLFEVSDDLNSEKYTVSAELLACDSRTAKQGYSYLDWTVPMEAALYSRDAKRDVQKALETVDAASCSSIAGSLYAYEFGQRYGDLAKELNELGYYRFPRAHEDMQHLLQTGFVLKDLESSTKLITLRTVNAFAVSQENIYANHWGDEPCRDAATLLECFGDGQFSLFSIMRVMGFTGVYPIALSMGRDNSPEIVCISAKTQKGSTLGYSVVKRKLFNEIEKEDESKVDNMTFYSDSIKITLIDRVIYLNRGTLNNLLGCGVTAQSQKGTAAAKLAGIGDFTIWGDGSLRNVELTGTSLRIPATVTSIAKESLGNVAHDSGSALTEIIIPASVEKIDKKAFIHPDDTYVRVAQREKIFSAPIYFSKVSDEVVEQMFKAMLTLLDNDYNSSCPIFAYKEDDKRYNKTLLLSLLKASSAVKYPYAFRKRSAMGTSERMTVEDIKKYFTAADIFEVLRYLICNELLPLFDRVKKSTVPSSDKFMKESTYENFDHLNLVPKWGRGYRMLSYISVLWNNVFRELLSEDKNLLRCIGDLYIEAIKQYRLCYKALRDYAIAVQGKDWIDRNTTEVENTFGNFEKRLKEAMEAAE